MKHKFLPNGNLVITADRAERAELRELSKVDDFHSDDMMWKILEPLICNSEFSWSYDELALVTCPCLVTRDQDNKIVEAYGFMSYETESLQEALMERGSAILRKG